MKTAMKKTNAEDEVKALTVRLAPIDSHLVIKPENAFDVATAVGQRNGLKTIAKDLKAKKDGIVKPLNEALKNVRELFRPVEQRLDDAILAVTRGLEEYNRMATAEVEAKRERMEAKVEKGLASLAKAAEVIDRAEHRLGVNAIPTRTVRVVRVVNESLVPDEYWVLDMTKIRSAALGGKSIPGVVVESVEQIFAT